MLRCELNDPKLPGGASQMALADPGKIFTVGKAALQSGRFNGSAVADEIPGIFQPQLR